MSESPAEWGSPHHRSPENSTGRLLLAAAIVLLLVLVAGGTTWWMYTRDPVAEPAEPVAQPSVPACSTPAMRVVAAPEIAGVVRDAARPIGPARGGCEPIEVVAEEPWITATDARRPDVWIPSSSAWLRMAPAGTYTTKGAALAHSPIVLAAPPAVLDLLGQGDQMSWAGLTAAVAGGKIPAVTMPDAKRSTVGLLSVFAVNAAMARTTPDRGIAQLRALTLRSRLTEEAADPASLLTKVAAEWNATKVINEVGVFPITEQQLTTYQRGGHAVQLKGAAPADGVVEADYPFAVGQDNRHKELTERLRAAIGPAALTAAGFRTEPTPNALTVPTKTEALAGPATQWAEYRSLTSQVLLLIDASGSMNDKIKDRAGRTTTRADLLRESGRTAVQLFSEDTSLGLWYFGSPTPASPPHTEIVPFGPITGEVGGKPRRDLLATAMAGYRADTTAGTPLYQSVLDASVEMREKVRPGTATLIVLLTDGDDGESKYAMTNAQFLTKLHAQQDPARMVPVIAMGYGPDADMKALSDMASATGGTAIAATNPADLASGMAKAFLAAHSTAR